MATEAPSSLLRVAPGVPPALPYGTAVVLLGTVLLVNALAIAVAQQDAIITQNIDGNATATADQQSDITQ